MMTALRHDPVMLAECLEMLALRPGMLVVDGTLGLAGHAREMWRLVQPGGSLLGTDWDTAMMADASEQLDGEAVCLVYGDYRCIPDSLEGLSKGETEGDGWEAKRGAKLPSNKADAILLDLGLNSAQIDDPERGISFMEPGPLDMRMDRTRGESASSFLNRASEDQIEKVLREFGEEKWSRRIAKIVVEHRKDSPLRTTQDLVDCILAAVPVAMRDKRLHPATRSFQGIRIAVNGELDHLEEAISEIAQALAPGGRMVVLSYHSLEDRAVKRAFRGLSEAGNFKELNRKPMEPTQEEIARNRRSRSAKLRALQNNTEETS